MTKIVRLVSCIALHYQDLSHALHCHVSSHRLRNTSDSFCETCKILFHYVDPQGRNAGLLAQDGRFFGLRLAWVLVGPAEVEEP